MSQIGHSIGILHEKVQIGCEILNRSILFFSKVIFQLLETKLDIRCYLNCYNLFSIYCTVFFIIVLQPFLVSEYRFKTPVLVFYFVLEKHLIFFNNNI